MYNLWCICNYQQWGVIYIRNGGGSDDQLTIFLLKDRYALQLIEQSNTLIEQS